MSTYSKKEWETVRNEYRRENLERQRSRSPAPVSRRRRVNGRLVPLARRPR